MLMYLSLVLFLAAQYYGPRLWAWYLVYLEELEAGLTRASEAVFPFTRALVEWSIAAVLPPMSSEFCDVDRPGGEPGDGGVAKEDP